MRTTFWKALSINMIYLLIFMIGFGGTATLMQMALRLSGLTLT